MRRFLQYPFVVSCGLFLACSLFVCPASYSTENLGGDLGLPLNLLQSVVVYPTPEGAKIEVQTDRPFGFVTYTLSHPDRLIVDPVDASLESALSRDRYPGDGLISDWGVVWSKGDGAGVDYLTFNLSEPAEHLVESTDNKLVIRVRPLQKKTWTLQTGEAGSLASRALAAPPFVGVPQDLDFLNGLADPYPSRPPSPEMAWNIEEAIGYGLRRHRPVQVAREEIRLAQFKLREAHRALFPAVNLRYSWTTGTASNVNFREVSSGVQVEQPLYYSGRLKDAYRQAIVNLQVAEKKEQKVQADYVVEAAQAYLQYVGAQAGAAAQRAAVQQAEEFQKAVDIRFDKGLLTRLEVLNVQTQVNQTAFQMATAESDLKLARIKFLQRFSLPQGTPVSVPSAFDPYEAAATPVDLEEAIQFANQYRVDIQLNRLLVEFNELEERVARAKGMLKVDLSGFLGASGSAFETEPLSLGKDYFVGLKATKAWGPHGASASITDTKTSPRLGQTTRTDSTVYSGEVGLWDQFQALSEVQQARVSLEKARNDYEDAKESVHQEVEEAYISYSKARIQLEYSRKKMAFREEQAKILTAQAGLNEVLPSQVLEAVLRLSDEKTSEIQALTNYYVALAKLNKAIGLPGHYK